MEEQLLEPAPVSVRTHVQEPIPVEFTGWMPAFAQFGNCGTHPQFNHISSAPPGYRFQQSQKAVIPFLRLEPVEPPEPTTWQKIRHALFALVLFARHSIYKITLSCFIQAGNLAGFGPVRFFATMLAALRLLGLVLANGCRLLPALKFVHSRHLTSQMMLPARPPLLFLTSVPYTLGQHPWVIEIEDAVTLFYPFIGNGQTADIRFESLPCFPAVKALLEDDRCRGILTHMRSTAAALPRLFQSDVIARKVGHVPMGVALPPVAQTHADADTIEFLFSCSWHQNPFSFFLRGGLEVIEAFSVLQERYPHVRLTLRTGLPDLDPRHRRMLEKSWVRIIDRFLPEDDMQSLMQNTHVFLIPAARIHIVSVLRAMSYGQVVVASDGWGFDEYVEHGHNGVIVSGRLGKTSWTDPESGMLREDYDSLTKPDPAFVDELILALSALVEDHALRRRLGAQARRDVAQRYNLTTWNRGLAAFLDRAAPLAA